MNKEEEYIEVEESKEYIEVEESRAMVYIPTDSIEMELISTVYCNGEIKKIGKKLNLQECQQAIKDAEDNYCAPDDYFVTTL